MFLNSLLSPTNFIPIENYYVQLLHFYYKGQSGFGVQLRTFEVGASFFISCVREDDHLTHRKYFDRCGRLAQQTN